MILGWQEVAESCNNMTTSADRQAKYRARMRAAGYVKLTVWVPVEYKRAVEQFVLDLTKARVAREKKSPAGERGE